MRRINIKDIVLLVEENVIEFVFSQAGGNEKIGALFCYKVKDTNEYVIDKYTEPHPDDISTSTYSAISRKHRKDIKKVQKADRTISSAGFYHTHPDSFGPYMSSIDFDVFESVSKGHILSVFFIAVTHSMVYYIYEDGFKIKEGIWEKK